MSGFSVLSRRRILGAGLTAGGMVLMSGLGLWRLRGAAPGVAGLRILSPHEYRTLTQLAWALFPAGGAFPQGAADADLARLFDGFLADEPEWNQGDLKKALLLLEYGPVLFERRLTTFSHLSEEERLAHFHAWRESSSDLRRQVSTAFHRFLCTVFYDRPEVWPALGYDGPLVTPEPAQ